MTIERVERGTVAEETGHADQQILEQRLARRRSRCFRDCAPFCAPCRRNSDSFGTKQCHENIANRSPILLIQVAQYQAVLDRRQQLLTGGLLVRIQPEEPFSEQKSLVRIRSSSPVKHRRGCCGGYLGVEISGRVEQEDVPVGIDRSLCGAAAMCHGEPPCHQDRPLRAELYTPICTRRCDG